MIIVDGKEEKKTYRVTKESYRAISPQSQVVKTTGHDQGGL